MIGSERDSLVLSHGQMAQHLQSTLVTITTQSVWVDIESGFTAGGGTGIVFQNSKELKVVEPGTYILNWNISLQTEMTNNINIVGGISVNGTIKSLTTAHGKIAASNDIINISGVGDLVLQIDDLIRLALINLDTTANFVVEHAGITMFMVEDP